MSERVVCMKRKRWLLLYLLLIVFLLMVSTAAAENESDEGNSAEGISDSSADTDSGGNVVEPAETPTPTPSKKDELYLHFLDEKDEVSEKGRGVLEKIRNWLNVKEEDLEKLPGWIRTGYTTFLICGVCLIPLCWVFGIFLAKSHKDNRKWVKRGYFGFCFIIPLVITLLLIGMPSLYIFFNRGL